MGCVGPLKLNTLEIFDQGAIADVESNEKSGPWLISTQTEMDPPAVEGSAPKGAPHVRSSREEQSYIVIKYNRACDHGHGW